MQHRQIRRWRRGAAATIAFTAVIATGVVPTTAGSERSGRDDHDEEAFGHVGTFDVRDNGTVSAEIVDATKDGRTLLYTDSNTGLLGFVDLRDPANPLPAGTLPIGGEPTSVAVTGRYALVATDLSAGNFVAPSGKLVVVDLRDRSIVREIPLSGQPDNVTVSPDERYATIVIENQRDESLNRGRLPQLPGGNLTILSMSGRPSAWGTRVVGLAGLPGMTDATDPEPEYADINERNQAVVTLQENNHLAIVDLRTARVTASFSAGSVVLENIDAVEERLGPQRRGRIVLDDSLTRRREPDTVQWVSNRTFAIANEGDYTDASGAEGGSRGFTVFDTTGTVVFESGASFEYEAIRAGHFNETRAANKGVEPEALEVGHYDDGTYLFVGGERANVVGVYRMRRGQPVFEQLLPTGIAPEGMKAIPRRDLLAVANETAAGIFPSLITIYELDDDHDLPSTTLVSANDANGLPAPWNAMSGLAADPTNPAIVYAVSDSVLSEAGIHTIDVSAEPAVITRRVLVTDAAGTVRNDLDLEGIAVAPEGGFWVASEGRVASGTRPNAILRVDANGVVLQEVTLPAALAATATSNGFEGIAATGTGTTQYVYVAVQRPWAGDPAETVKIGRYEVATGQWTFVQYALDPLTLPTGAVIGLSEITLLPDGTFAIIERDGLAGRDAVQKKVYGVDLAAAEFRPLGEPLVTVVKVLLTDLLDEMREQSIYTPDKLEGLTVTADGQVVAVTDNDGLIDALGQTLLLRLGPVAEAFNG